MYFIILVTLFNVCCGYNLKILMDRMNNLENKFDAENKIRRQEMAAVFQKMSVIDSLEAKVNDLSGDVVGTDTAQATEIQQELHNDERLSNRRDINDFKKTVKKALMTEKMRNRKLREDLESSKLEIMKILELENRTRQLDTDVEIINDAISGMNISLTMIKSAIADVESKSNVNNDVNTKIETMLEHVAENVTALQTMHDKKTSPVLEDIWESSCTTLKPTQDSGVYEIKPVSFLLPFHVYCDQDTDGGGWIVFQRRTDGSVDFEKGWTDYKYGFGDLKGEFWLGNEYLSLLTADGYHELRIDMEDYYGKKYHAKYNNFKIHPESDNYRLVVGGYSGDYTLLELHNQSMFSTIDKDNASSGLDCAYYWSYGWWLHTCAHPNMNNRYTSHGVLLKDLKGDFYFIKFVEMKFRAIQ